MNKINMLLLVLFCFNLAVGQERSESDDFSYALKLYNEKFYNLAAQQFTRFINNYPQSDKLDEAGYYTGLSYFFLKEYKNARVEFQGVAVNYPKSKRAADSWFKIGECYDNLGNKEEEGLDIGRPSSR